MSLSVEVSARASERLEDIATYITVETGFPRRAAKFVAALLRKARALGVVAPSIGVFYTSSVTSSEFRAFAHRGYRIIYAIIDERVIIVDFFHHARSTASMHRSLDGFRP